MLPKRIVVALIAAAIAAGVALAGAGAAVIATAGQTSPASTAEHVIWT
jgi:hypothetical protein